MDLSLYYEEICREPLMTKEEEATLIGIYKNPESSDEEREKAKDRIIRANLRFVFERAKYHSVRDPSMMEELILLGNEGLLVGLEKYNASHKTRFLTYAGWWVKQRILKGMSKMRLVSLPISKQQIATKIARMKDRDPSLTLDDVKKLYPKVSEKDLKDLFENKYLTFYIEDLGDAVMESKSVEEQAEQALANAKLNDAVKELPSPHREIIQHTFGLEDGREMKISHLCKVLVLTRNQLRELKKEALEMLRQKLSDD